MTKGVLTCDIKATYETYVLLSYYCREHCDDYFVTERRRWQ
jgi:hypothetical protein